jgi:preprotein translocase subunit YajC
VFMSPAFAQASGGASGEGGLVTLLPIVLMFVLLYFIMIRPQVKRQKEHRTMVEGLQKGDEVVTSGGVVGKITDLRDAYVCVETAPNTEIIVQKSAVQTLLPKGTIKSIK